MYTLPFAKEVEGAPTAATSHRADRATHAPPSLDVDTNGISIGGPEKGALSSVRLRK
jgi:hypothetical protein